MLEQHIIDTMHEYTHHKFRERSTKKPIVTNGFYRKKKKHQIKTFQTNQKSTWPKLDMTKINTKHLITTPLGKYCHVSIYYNYSRDSLRMCTYVQKWMSRYNSLTEADDDIKRYQPTWPFVYQGYRRNWYIIASLREVY